MKKRSYKKLGSTRGILMKTSFQLRLKKIQIIKLEKFEDF